MSASVVPGSPAGLLAHGGLAGGLVELGLVVLLLAVGVAVWLRGRAQRGVDDDQEPAG